MRAALSSAVSLPVIVLLTAFAYVRIWRALDVSIGWAPSCLFVPTPGDRNELFFFYLRGLLYRLTPSLLPDQGVIDRTTDTCAILGVNSAYTAFKVARTVEFEYRKISGQDTESLAKDVGVYRVTLLIIEYGLFLFPLFFSVPTFSFKWRWMLGALLGSIIGRAIVT
jgi:hypothetical protein